MKTKPTHVHPPETVDTAGAAVITGVAPMTLAAWRVDGDGPPFVKLGRVVRYLRSDLLAWLESCRATSTAQAEAKAAANLRAKSRARKAG